MIKGFLKKDFWIRASFFLFLTSIPFGTRKFIYPLGSPVNDYDTIYIYLSDLALILFFICFLAYSRKSGLDKDVSIPQGQAIPILAFLIFAEVSVFYASYESLAFYYLIRLVALSAMALSV